MHSISYGGLLLLFIFKIMFSSFTFCDKIEKDLIILTDMEPDDRIALAMVANRPELSKRLLFVGTTLLNTQLKAALAKRQLEQSGLQKVPVYAGTGGTPSSYPNNVETAKAALNFWPEEGNGILSAGQLKKLREIGPEESASTLDDKTFSGMSPIEDLWSIVLDNLQEFRAPIQTDRYLDDYNAVIKLLDLLNIANPPKFVYRMPNPQGILIKGKPRRLKVFFPTARVTPVLLENWNETEIHEYVWKNGFPGLKIRHALNVEKFERIKKRFNNAENIAFQRWKEERTKRNEMNKADEASENKFHDKDEPGNNARDEVSSLLADVNFQMITEFLKSEEEWRSVRIMCLPEHRVATVDADGNEQMLPPAWPSQRYKGDFDAVRDLLFAMGVEVAPLAIRRLGKEVNYDRGQRHLQVIFPSKRIADLVLLAWKRNKHYIRAQKNSKSEWRLVGIKEFNEHLTEATVGEDTIGNNKKQLSDMLEYVQDTVVQTGGGPSTESEKKKGKRQMTSVNLANIGKNELQRALVNTFSRAKKNSIEILLMTAPIDLVKVLVAAPELAKAIQRVHLMGGWVELKELREPPVPLNPSEDFVYEPLPPSPPTIWGNYNLNMAPESSRRLFEMASVDKILSLRLYTYRHIWEMFEGSVNRNTWLEIHGDNAIELIKKSRSQVLQDFRIAAKSWDEHAMKLMPYLTRFIDQYAGEQFSPADPILVIGLLNPSAFIKEQRRVNVHVKHEELDGLNDVLEVQIEYDQPDSKIELITGLVKSTFRRELGISFRHCFKCGLLFHRAKDCGTHKFATGNSFRADFHRQTEVKTHRGPPEEHSQDRNRQEEHPQTSDAAGFRLEGGQFPALDAAKKPSAEQQTVSKKKVKATNDAKNMAKDEKIVINADAKTGDAGFITLENDDQFPALVTEKEPTATKNHGKNKVINEGTIKATVKTDGLKVILPRGKNLVQLKGAEQDQQKAVTAATDQQSDSRKPTGEIMFGNLMFPLEETHQKKYQKKIMPLKQLDDGRKKPDNAPKDGHIENKGTHEKALHVDSVIVDKRPSNSSGLSTSRPRDGIPPSDLSGIPDKLPEHHHTTTGGDRRRLLRGPRTKPGGGIGPGPSRFGPGGKQQLTGAAGSSLDNVQAMDAAGKDGHVPRNIDASGHDKSKRKSSIEDGTSKEKALDKDSGKGDSPIEKEPRAEHSNKYVVVNADAKKEEKFRILPRHKTLDEWKAEQNRQNTAVEVTDQFNTR